MKYHTFAFVSIFIFIFFLFVFSFKSVLAIESTLKANSTGVKCYDGTSTNSPPGITEGVLCSAADKLEVGASDDNREYITEVNSQYTFFWANYTLPRYSSINWIYVYWEGNDGSSASVAQCQLRIYRFSTSTWVTFNGSFGSPGYACGSSGVDIDSTYNLTSNINNYISNNMFYVLADEAISYNPMYIDYAYIILSYNPLTFDGITNHTYDTTDTPLCTDDSASANLYLNDSSTTYNNTAITLGVGGYNWTCNSTTGSISIIQSITRGNPTTNMVLTLDGSSSTSQTRTYPNATNVQSSESNSGDSDCSYTLYQNGTTASNGAITLAARTYNYTYAQAASTCTNYTTGQIQRILTVNKNTTSLKLNGVQNVTYGTQLRVNCTANIPCELYRNTTGTDVVDVTTTENNTLITLGTRAYNYTTNVSADTENYTTPISNISYVVISQATPTLAIVGITNSTYPYSETIYTTSNDVDGLSLTFIRNGTTNANNTPTTYPVGLWNFTSIVGNVNYSTTSISVWNNILQGNQSISLTGITNNTYPYSVTPICIGNVTSNLYRNGSSAVNSSTIQLEAGDYIWTCNTTNNSNYTFTTTSVIQTVNRASPSLNLLLNGSSFNFTTDSGGYVNITTTVNNAQGIIQMYNNTSLMQSCSSNSCENISSFSGPAATTFNITGFYPQTENYTSGSETWDVQITPNTAPSITDTYEPTDPSVYTLGTVWRFNATVCDAEGNFDITIFEWNATNTTITTYNSLGGTCRLYYTNKTDLKVGYYVWKWYANDTNGLDSPTSNGDFTINQKSISIILYLNGTSVDKWYQIGQIANMTSSANYFTTINLAMNMTGWTQKEDMQNILNTTLMSGIDGIVYNTTTWIKDTENFTGTMSDTQYIKMDSTTPLVRSFSINGSYINVNETVLLEVNTTDATSGIEMVLAEIQTSGGLNNYTLSLFPSGNYSRYLNKTDLGDKSLNSTIINITKIYSNDSTDNLQANTTTLNFTYAKTYITDYDETPNPVTNSLGQYITIWTIWNTTENTELKSGNCFTTVGSTDYSMSYTSSRWQVQISTASAVTGIYSYNITCSNSSYQTATNKTGIFEVTSGLGGGGGGGGGGTTIIVGGNASWEIYPGTIQIFGEPGAVVNFTYKITNTDIKRLYIKPVFMGVYSAWFNIKAFGQPMSIYQLAPQPEYVSIEPGNSTEVTIQATIPLDTKMGDYEMNINFVDKDSQTTQARTVKISITPLQPVFDILKKTYSKLSWGLEIKSHCSPTITREGICIIGAKEVTIPGIGALIFITIFVSIFILLKKTKQLYSKPTLRFIISLSICAIILILLPIGV